MTVTVNCKCGWFAEQLSVSDMLEAELIGDRHESNDIKRPYRHDTNIEIIEKAA